MSEVEVRDLSAASIEDQLGQLRELNTIGPLRDEYKVELTFCLESDPEPMAIAVFAQAMLGVRSDVHFLVHLPTDYAMLQPLIRNGIASALARRGELVSYLPPIDLAPDDLWRTWTPGAYEVMAPMFGAEAPGESLFGRDHALFINPHLTTEPQGEASITPLLRRWLTQVVTPELPEDQQREVIGVPIFSVDQLVRNVREHAMMSSRPSIVDSVLALQVLSQRTTRKLLMTVLDTGAGIAQTLRPKIGEADAGLNDGELMAELLRGNLPGWDRGRGFGLSSVAEWVALLDGASLDLWSGTTRVHAGREVEHHAVGVGLAGTVVNALFPLPSA